MPRRNASVLGADPGGGGPVLSQPMRGTLCCAAAGGWAGRGLQPARMNAPRASALILCTIWRRLTQRPRRSIGGPSLARIILAGPPPATARRTRQRACALVIWRHGGLGRPVRAGIRTADALALGELASRAL